MAVPSQQSIDQDMAHEWREYFDERAGVAEYDGGMSRAEAERQAFEVCVVKWMSFNPPAHYDLGTCPNCYLPAVPETASLPVLIPRGGHIWIHANCLESWQAGRRQEAIRCLKTMLFIGEEKIKFEQDKNR
jgi:hypothetical protein